VEGLGYIYLDNPKTKNALSGRMMHDFVTAIEEASSAVAGATKLRCLVLQGKNDAFCAGADFTLAREVLTTPELGLAMCKFMTDVTNHLLALPVISAAVVTGPAMGKTCTQQSTTSSSIR
jgi:enoyl-CoA hydratase/carnithine racemase